jgi:uncharacterized protein
MFQFELVLTEKCNLNCSYCYMKNRAYTMDDETFDAHYDFLKSFLLEKFGKTRFTATLFGGEPLLNWDLIEYILPILSKDPDCDGIVCPTNGILLFNQPDKIKFLKDHGVNISLSYDGLWYKKPRSEHFSGEYYDKYKTLIKELDIQNCKVMVYPKRDIPRRNFRLAVNYIYFVEQLGIWNPDFTLVRDDIWDDEDIKQYEDELKDLADKVIDYNKKGYGTLPGPFSLYLLDTLAGGYMGKRSFGCFAGCHGAGFMPDGLVYPCARFGSERTHAIGDSNCMVYYGELENWLKNPIKTNPQLYKKCRKCNLYSYCNAGCTFSQEKNGYEPLDSICKLFKITYKEAFKIVDELKDNESFKGVFNNMTENIYGQ